MRVLGLVLVGLGALVTYWALGLDRSNTQSQAPQSGGSGLDPNSLPGAGQGGGGSTGGSW